MSDPKDSKGSGPHGSGGFSPKGARESLQKGLFDVVRAARSAGEGIQREIKKGGIQKTVEDGGREILRAATNVATFVGSELKDWGEKVQQVVDPPLDTPPAGHTPSPQGGVRVAPPPVASWPASREEFETRYGKVAGDWPKSPEEFERRFGYPPAQKPVGPTDHDPGFRIVSGDESK